MLPSKSNGRAGKGGIVAQDVTKNFIQHFGLHGLLHKVFSALLQGSKNIFLVADGRHHHDARLGILAHNALDRFDAFHLRHGNVHQDDIRLRAVLLSDSRQAVTGFAGNVAAEELHHLDDILSREDRVVHNEIADRLVIFPEQSGKLWHNLLLDPGPRSRTVCGSRYPFNFFVLVGLVVPVVLVGTIELFLARRSLRCAIASKIRDQMLANHVEWHDAICITLQNGGTRHSRDNAGVLALRDRHSASGFHGALPFGAVFTHACHQNSHAHWAKFLRDRVEKHVYGRPVAIHRSRIAQHRHVSSWHAAHHHVAITWTNQRAPRQQEIAGLRLLNFQFTTFIQPASKHFRETFGHMLDDQQAAGKLRGNLRKNKLERVWSARGNTNSDNAMRWQRDACIFLYWLDSLRDCRRPNAASRCALSHFNLFDQLSRDGVQMAGRRLFRFCNEVDCAKSKGFECRVRPFFRMSADHDHGERRTAHNEPQRFHTVHSWHFKVERDDVGTKFLNLFQRESTVHGRADDVNHRIARKNIGNQFPHQCGIIYHKNSNAFAHAIAPRGIARERRERTAGTFRINTTVPSPRIEAPLTRSLATISAGSALMTSSSSPTNWSTTRPKRFSAAPMTMTKLFFAFFTGSTA